MKQLFDIVDKSSMYPVISSLINVLSVKESELTPEQRVERQERIRIQNEQRALKNNILKNTCPNCEGKLIRGNKEKENNYRRRWSCNNCNSSYSM